MAEKNTHSILETIKKKMLKIDQKSEQPVKVSDGNEEFQYISSGAPKVPAALVEVKVPEPVAPKFEDNLGLDLEVAPSPVKPAEKTSGMGSFDDFNLDDLDLDEEEKTFATPAKPNPPFVAKAVPQQVEEEIDEEDLEEFEDDVDFEEEEEELEEEFVAEVPALENAKATADIGPTDWLGNPITSSIETDELNLDVDVENEEKLEAPKVEEVEREDELDLEEPEEEEEEQEEELDLEERKEELEDNDEEELDEHEDELETEEEHEDELEDELEDDLEEELEDELEDDLEEELEDDLEDELEDDLEEELEDDLEDELEDDLEEELEDDLEDELEDDLEEELEDDDLDNWKDEKEEVVADKQTTTQVSSKMPSEDDLDFSDLEQEDDFLETPKVEKELPSFENLTKPVEASKTQQPVTFEVMEAVVEKSEPVVEKHEIDLEFEKELMGFRADASETISTPKVPPINHPMSEMPVQNNVSVMNQQTNEVKPAEASPYDSTVRQVGDSVKKLLDAKNVVSGISSFSQSPALSELALHLMEPKIEKWFNDNLPELVEKIVREEIKKMIPRE